MTDKERADAEDSPKGVIHAVVPFEIKKKLIALKKSQKRSEPQVIEELVNIAFQRANLTL